MRSATAIAFFFVMQIAVCQSLTSFNEGWDFHFGTDTSGGSWRAVALPHTWNASDPFDKEPGYYRGICWYRKTLRHNSFSKNRQYLIFEGVNQEAHVYLNGVLVGTHLGGYTAFNLEVTELLERGPNQLLVKVNNGHNEAIPPLKGDFNFYGGIYRDVWLLKINEVHFDLSEYGDRGIFVTTPQVSEKEATVNVRSNINNQSGVSQSVAISHSLFDYRGGLVAQWSERKRLDEGLNKIEATLSKVANPQLWSPDSPTLYWLESEIKGVEGNVLDKQANPVGFRWFRFDADEGFFINDQYLKLMGTNRHQDLQGFGNALSDRRHVQDIRTIKDMGSNFFRTAHYPQDPSVMDAADRLGLVVSMEIPLDHEITDSKQFLDNSKRMMTEMIRQNFNHPSVFIWAYMNEMLLGRKWEEDKEIIDKIRLQAFELEELTRQEDPTRYTMIPNHGDLDLYINSGLTDIPMIVGWNLYFGWYEADGEGAGKFLDRFHKLVPDKPVLVTEYGAGADSRIRSLSPERFDFSIEWQNQFHQSNLTQFTDRKYLSGAAIWNIADFGSESRKDVDPKINSKGVLEMDRSPKDAFYLYQSWLKEEPFVKIGSRNWSDRTIVLAEGGPGRHSVDVYTNSELVKLQLNGESLGEKQVENHIARWEVSFTDGTNKIAAEIMEDDNRYTDQMEIEVDYIKPGQVNWYAGIYINCGATFYFTDREGGVTWLPDRPYSKGLWGYHSGTEFRPRDRGIGSDRTILSTANDPIYQTVRIAPSRYSFDAGPGTYEIAFHWAEVNRTVKQGNAKRIFDVLINGQIILSELDVMRHVGFSTALAKKVQFQSSEEQLNIDFRKIEGEPMINSISIRKLN